MLDLSPEIRLAAPTNQPSLSTFRPLLDRTDFGISWNAPLPNGALTLAEQVRLVLDVEAVKAAS